MFFFRVELSLFDEERQTIYLYPDTQALDKDEMPVFSETALKSNPVFKKYIKRLKTNVVDIKYMLYNTDTILPDELTDDMFSQLQEKNKLELMCENEFCIICGKSKSKSGHKNNSSMLVLIVVIVAGVLLLGAMSMRKGKQSATSGMDDSSAVIDSSQTEPEESSDNSSDISTSDENSALSAESGDNSQSSTEPPENVTSSSDISASSTDTTSNESTTTSSVISSTTPQIPSGSVSLQPTESTSTVPHIPPSSTSESSRENTMNIFNIQSQSDMAVTLYYDTEEPTVSFIAPDGTVILASELSSSRGDGAVCYYISSAIAGQWKISYDKKANNFLDVNWAPYAEQAGIPQSIQSNLTSENGGSV